MSADVHNELSGFHDFVGERLRNGGSHLTPEEVLEEWLLLHPNLDQHAQNVKAIRAAIRDMEAGDQGLEVEDHLLRLREEFGLEGET